MTDPSTSADRPNASGAPGAPRDGGSGRLAALLIHGPRGSFRWTAYALAVTAFAAAIPTPLYPRYENQFHFGSATLGLVFAAYTPGVFLTLFFVAPQAERIGRRTLLYAGLGLTAVAAAVFALADGVVWLAVARAVSGLAVGATTSVATAAMSDLEPYRDQHHVARVAVAANFGGFAIGALLSGVVVSFAPHPAQTVYLLPIVAAAVGLFAVAATPETATALEGAAAKTVQRIAVPAAVRRPFWVAVGGVAACYSIYGLFAALVPSYVRSELAIHVPWAAGAIVALMFGLAAMTQLATAQLRDQRALLVGFPLLVVTLAVLVLVLPLTSWALVALATAGLGVSVGITFMGSVTLADRIAPEEARGEMLAGFYAGGYLALAVPTIGIAEASERIGLANAGALFGFLLASAAALLFAVTYRTALPAGGEGRPRSRTPRA